jgi:hypothetical protein
VLLTPRSVVVQFISEDLGQNNSEDYTCPSDLAGKEPCYVNGARFYFDLKAVI